MKKLKKSTSQIRIQKEKSAFLEQLKRTPIIQVVCEKINIGRATFYRWKSDDSIFSQAVEDAFLEGHLLVNDLAESQLIGAVKDRNLSAITYWLKHHHKDYKNRIEIEGNLNTIQELSAEQKELVQKALRLASLDFNQHEK